MSWVATCEACGRVFGLDAVEGGVCRGCRADRAALIAAAAKAEAEAVVAPPAPVEAEPPAPEAVAAKVAPVAAARGAHAVTPLRGADLHARRVEALAKALRRRKHPLPEPQADALREQLARHQAALAGLGAPA